MSLIRHAARLMPAVVALLLMAAVPADVAPRVHAAAFENSHAALTGHRHNRLAWDAARRAAAVEEAESDPRAEQLGRLIAGLLAVTDEAAPSFVPVVATTLPANASPRRIRSAHRPTGPPTV